MKKIARVLFVLFLAFAPLLAGVIPAAEAAPAQAQVVVEIQPNGDEGMDTYIRTGLSSPQGFSTLAFFGPVSPSSVNRALLYFDLSDIPANASIISADLVLVIGQSNRPAATAQVYLLSECYAEPFATWANRDNGIAWTSAGGTYGSMIGSYSYPILPLNSSLTISLAANDIQHIVTGYYQNCGFLVRHQDENLSSVQSAFYTSEYFDVPSYRPKLVITYNIPDPTVTPTPSPTLPLYPTLNAEQFTLTSGNPLDVERRASFGEIGVMISLLCLAVPFGALTWATYLNRRR